MEQGHWTDKSKALAYAREKNKLSRKYHYKVKRPSYHGKPGYEKVQKGWTVSITKK